MANRVEIVDYDPGWPAEFAALAAALVEGLGELAIAIDHIGSTSVPGLAAKDVIDIQVTVDDLGDERLVRCITDAGYCFRPGQRDNLVGLDDASPELEKLYFYESPDTRRIHVHVREQGRLNQQYPLLFRDYLRADTFVRAAYERVKRELAQRFAGDAVAYYAVKDPYMDTVYRAALLWDANGRPSDAGR